MPKARLHHLALAGVTATVAVASLFAGLIAQPASAAPVRAMTAAQLQAQADNATEPLQRRIDAQLQLAPHGRQISANEVAWNGGKVIMSFPLDGQRVAPNSSPAALKLMAAATPQSAARKPVKIRPQDIEGCPTVTFGADWFCLYADINWGGRRLQWSTSCIDYLSNYGFENEASSWVNGGALYINVNDPSQRIWLENPHTKSSWVGSANNDRATWFTTSHSC
jgi:hypothetical protein